VPKLIVETFIAAPREVVFDAARDIGLHCQTASHTRERAVAGVTSGLIGLGESVTFEGVHFGVRQRLTARITEFDASHRFVDEMTKGAFQSLRHVHEFETAPGGTLMRDTIEWTAPFGPIGRIADALFLKHHLRNFLRRRNADLKDAIENSAL
jgi:ligand-binding SRPBCC domain-containing protein